MTSEQRRKIAWLNRAYYADRNAQAWQAKLERDRSLARRLTRCSDSAGGNGSVNATEDYLIRLAETERKTQEKLKELIRIRDEIIAAVHQLEDMEMQAILVRHFLAYETFDFIAEKMHCSRPTIMRKYKQAIDKMILNDTL